MIIEAIKQQGSEEIRILNPDDLKFRPIIAGPVNPTHRLSQMIDTLLKPYIKYVKSYVRDDIQFLSTLPNQISETETMVSFDVTALYSNIEHELGIKAIT